MVGDNSFGFKSRTVCCFKEKLFSGLMENKDVKDFYRLEPPSGLPFNRYGFPYNVAGFEFLYVKKVFNLVVSDDFAKSYWDMQLKCYGLTDKGGTDIFLTEDKANLLLRSYELSYLLVD